MVPILSGGSGRETYEVTSMNGSCHLLEGTGRQMVTFVHDHLAIVGHHLINLPLTCEALK